MATFEDTVSRNADLVRKPLQGSVLLGKYPTAPLISTLSAVSGGITIPAGYDSVGWISEDGLTFANDTEVSDVRGWGASSFLRRDIQSQDKTIQFACLETKRLTIELASGLDLSGAVMSAAGATAGEVSWDHPDRPPTRYWRVLAIGVDGDGDGRYYMARFFPRASVSEMDDETWSDGDDPLMRNVTLSALIDNEAGYVGREFLFGPGALAAAEDMGWTLDDA